GREPRGRRTLGGQRRLLGSTAPLGDVLDAVGQTLEEVAQHVEAVTVGQPPRRPQGAYVASLTALPEPVAFEAPGPDPTWPGVDVQEGRELVARLSDRTHRQQPQDPE